MKDHYYEEQIDHYAAKQAFIMHLNLAYDRHGEVTISDAVTALEIYKEEVQKINANTN